MSRSNLEEVFASQMTGLGIPFVREHRFDKIRKWRFDFAIIKLKIAMECEGGIFIRGRHTRGYGFQADCDKYNAAAYQGWRVFRFTSTDIKSLKAVTMIMTLINPQIAYMEDDHAEPAKDSHVALSSQG